MDRLYTILYLLRLKFLVSRNGPFSRQLKYTYQPHTNLVLLHRLEENSELCNVKQGEK